MPLVRLHFQTVPGQHLLVLGDEGLPPEIPLRWTEGGWWVGEVPDVVGGRYRYALRTDDGTTTVEPGLARQLPAGVEQVVDRWRPRDGRERALAAGAFTRVLRRRPDPRPGPVGQPVGMRLFAPDLDPRARVLLVGDGPALGGWDPTRGIELGDDGFPWWTADVDPGPGPVEYKYVVAEGDDVHWEDGPNRVLPAGLDGRTLVHDQGLGWHPAPWRGAGVALPLFSLRVTDGAGVGRFTDLERLVDWAADAGMHLIQLLPVNDTTLTHGPADSYPYSPISSVALHPMYVDTGRIGVVADPAVAAEVAAERSALDALDALDHTRLMDVTWRELRALHDQVVAPDTDIDLIDFRAAEADWLPNYTAFCVLRDRHGPDREAWGELATFDPEALGRLRATDPSFVTEETFHAWVQWHLHRQLAAAVEHGRRRGVIMKGDLPIGVSPDSVDVWEDPDQFHVDQSAGAPPDMFSDRGQNWLFPTYRWDHMADDGYRWWRRRLRSMAIAVDAYRVDHVLGFFRIWQVPTDQVHGTMGRFEPCLPLSVDDVVASLGWFDHARLCEPWITRETLTRWLGDDADDPVVTELLQPVTPDRFAFVDGISTQMDLWERLGEDHPLVHGLMALISERLLLEVVSDGEVVGYHPRVYPDRTVTHSLLGESDRHRWSALVEDFYFRRHEEQWEARGRTTLPAVLDASDLLVCGEDLGLVPDMVPGVLRDLGVLTLEIERAPKRLGLRVADPADAPELSVVATGTHDMATLRGWWEDEPDGAAAVWAQLGHDPATTPPTCTPEAAAEVVAEHLRSPAVWAILPWQDLLASDADLRAADPHGEQINVPANPRHVWNWRMHLTVEELGAAPLTARLRSMVVEAGRSTP